MLHSLTKAATGAPARVPCFAASGCVRNGLGAAVTSKGRTCHQPVISKHHFRSMFTGHLSPCHHLSPPGSPSSLISSLPTYSCKFRKVVRRLPAYDELADRDEPGADESVPERVCESVAAPGAFGGSGAERGRDGGLEPDRAAGDAVPEK